MSTVTQCRYSTRYSYYIQTQPDLRSGTCFTNQVSRIRRSRSGGISTTQITTGRIAVPSSRRPMRYDLRGVTPDGREPAAGGRADGCGGSTVAGGVHRSADSGPAPKGCRRETGRGTARVRRLKGLPIPRSTICMRRVVR